MDSTGISWQEYLKNSVKQTMEGNYVELEMNRDCYDRESIDYFLRWAFYLELWCVNWRSAILGTGQCALFNSRLYPQFSHMLVVNKLHNTDVLKVTTDAKTMLHRFKVFGRTILIACLDFTIMSTTLQSDELEGDDLASRTHLINSRSIILNIKWCGGKG